MAVGFNDPWDTKGFCGVFILMEITLTTQSLDNTSKSSQSDAYGGGIPLRVCSRCCSCLKFSFFCAESTSLQPLTSTPFMSPVQRWSTVSLRGEMKEVQLSQRGFR